MLRRLSTIAAGAAMLALSALPASASIATTTTHKLYFPSLSGVSAWGTYTRSGSHVKAHVCVDDATRGEFAAAAVFLAYNSNYSKHQKGGAVDIGYHDTQCVTMNLVYTSHLKIYSFVGGSNGRIVRTSKTKGVY
ncbi:MAG: hypothetical protein ACRDPY_29050 [Streptosporangiaceae bacterium]